MNLKNSQYQAIMRQYDLRQMEHRHQQTLRYEELCNKLPVTLKIRLPPFTLTEHVPQFLDRPSSCRICCSRFRHFSISRGFS